MNSDNVATVIDPSILLIVLITIINIVICLKPPIPDLALSFKYLDCCLP